MRRDIGDTDIGNPGIELFGKTEQVAETLLTLGRKLGGAAAELAAFIFVGMLQITGSALMALVAFMLWSVISQAGF